MTSYVFLSASFPRGRAKVADPCGRFRKFYGGTSRFENETNRISPKTHQYCAYYGQRGPKLKPKNLKKKTKIKSFFRGGREPEEEHQLGSQKKRNDLKEVFIAMFLQHYVYHTIDNG